MPIIQLDKQTIEQIAAGEVIESPFSIVKELLENSIDAGSKNITVEVKNGGKRYIRVTDDGHGIAENEIEIAFQRHATSKIKKFSDLYKLYTLGFRGEALSSIITCSDLTIISKTKDQEIGKKLNYLNGKLAKKSSIATNTGTTIEVFNLFRNQPVRRKFLKSDISESNKINKLMYAIAISNPNLSIKYIRDDKIDFHTNNEDLKTIITKILDENLEDNIIPISIKNQTYNINGFITNSSYYRGNRSLQYLYVNNRYVYSEIITRAIEKQYRSIIPNLRYPCFFLFINTDSKNIDINIHPNKKEIKFVYEDELIELISKNISKILYENNSIKIIKKIDNEEEEINFYDDYQQIVNSYNKLVSESNSIYEQNNDLKKAKEKIFFEDYSIAKEKNVTTTPINFIDVNDNNNTRDKHKDPNKNKIFDDMVYKTSIFNRYSIYEKNDKLFILDHRRAEIAINFSKFILEFENKEVYSQKLLEPVILKLDTNSYNSYILNEEIFEALGFGIEKFGDAKIIIRYLPIIFKNPENLDYFYDLLDIKYNSSKESLYKKIFKIVSNFSFRKGNRINKDEADYLIENLKKLKNPYKTFDGKNTIILVNNNELEKYFDK